jgi:hypothetical protein
MQKRRAGMREQCASAAIISVIRVHVRAPRSPSMANLRGHTDKDALLGLSPPSDPGARARSLTRRCRSI